MPKHPKKPTSKLRNSSIILNGKEHSLLTTKGYILKEYADVFNGIGISSWSTISHTTKGRLQSCSACTLHSTSRHAASLLSRITDTIAWRSHSWSTWLYRVGQLYHEPVQKPHGEIRLCLDPRDLNKMIKRNAWCMRTLDDVLPTTLECQEYIYGWCHVWILACHAWSSEQSTHHVQHTMGQIQMVKTTLWTQNSIRCISRKTG